MRTSSATEVRDLYEESAESYAGMMDSEIDLPIYADLLRRLAGRIAELPGSVIDTSCGPGHLLARYGERFDPGRSLIGIDLSPAMCELARARTGDKAQITTGDMRDLSGIDDGSSAAVLSFFALHHLDPPDIVGALREWRRVLAPEGQLLIAAWEGEGLIDYGEVSDVLALKYSKKEILNWVEESGFSVTRCTVEPVEGLPMDAVYLEATRSPRRK